MQMFARAVLEAVKKWEVEDVVVDKEKRSELSDRSSDRVPCRVLSLDEYRNRSGEDRAVKC